MSAVADDEPSALVDVPMAHLAPETLRAVVESFVLREGTDYGGQEVPLTTKVAQVMKQLQRGEARIVFDPATESVDIRVVLGK
ncbi:MAG TPA: YheU family protein [Steroidobacteraceae bacterium]